MNPTLMLGLPSGAPFFENKDRAFWNLQTLGWLGWFALQAVGRLANNQPWSSLVPIIISGITGFSITLLLAGVFNALIDRRPMLLWGATLVLTVIGAVSWAAIDAWVLQLQNPDAQSGFASLLLVKLYIDGVSLAAWVALYYAINYYIRLEEQEDRMLRLEAQAASAQLAMLRYQLNPHFLFNTLNSISTLVLLRQTEPANAMLSRLSSFLRYTLANEPTAQVTLLQEVETLKLYLEIEQMRFEDRLRTHFSIDPAVTQARLPSLLLQPLIENAIKYAVSPQEEGADITLAAQLAGQNVRIIVSDTGPGLPPTGGAPTPGTHAASTGLGLGNIRDRLAQAFGDQHRFETGTNAEGGFVVTIELPLQVAPQPPRPVARPVAPEMQARANQDVPTT